MKPGDLVRVRKAAIDKSSTTWFRSFAIEKTPMIILEIMKSNNKIAKCFKPNGTTCYIRSEFLTKKF